MRTQFILLVGAAGTGKTWVAKQLIKRLNLLKVGKVGMVLYHRNGHILVLGKYDGSTFEGSDKLSMAVMRDLPLFQEFAKDFRFVFCEGDRFMNSTFIKATDPYIIKLTRDGSEGRAKRGSNQTERQLKSLTTRVANVKADELVERSETALKVIESILSGRKKV